MSDKKVIENTSEARDEFGHAYGSSEVEIEEHEITALKNGKCIAIRGGEYNTFISMDKSKRYDWECDTCFDAYEDCPDCNGNNETNN